MIKITLQDGSASEINDGSSISEIIEKTPEDKVNPVVYAKIGEEPVDLSYKPEHDISVKLLRFDDVEGKSVYWHSTAHIMAHAVKNLFPSAKFGIGPSIKDGFYYDFDVEKPFTEDDLKAIEKEMEKIIKSNSPFERKELPRSEAEKFFRNLGDTYKEELARELDGDNASLYREGDFVDLCRGPHVLSTGRIGVVKLLSVAGSYWRGDEHGPQLQRIYGVSYPAKKELKEHLNRLEEVRKLDHRVLGKKLDLFSTDEEIGPGLIIWHQKGSLIRSIIEEFWLKEHRCRGYDYVYTPHIATEKVYIRSGHMENYADMMYSPMDIDTQLYYIKPMNCPAHIKIYQSKLRSYRDLPMRLAELGTVYRYERSGVLHGMLRVRGFTQDDAHIFCRPDQLTDEINKVLDLTILMMETFGYTFKVFLSTRPEKYIGTDEQWESAIKSMEEALKIRGLDFEIDEGGGVFYAPKIDIKLFDALGRDWQGPTCQVDLNLPEKFDINYIDKDGKPHRVIMIHRTVLGSMERFVGGLIEHYAGAFPVWLSPVQVVLIPITEHHVEYARKIYDKLTNAGIRCDVDDRSEKMGFKIREAQANKIPYMLIMGDREMEQNTISVRHRTDGDMGSSSIDEFLKLVRTENDEKTIH